MSDLQLSIAMHPNARSRPVLEGRIKPDGIDLLVTNAHPSEIFWRQLHFGEFDISEMSMSSLLILLASGNRDWVACRSSRRGASSIPACGRATTAVSKSPGDMSGKRVGVPEYQQTAALGAAARCSMNSASMRREIEWWMEATEEVSHGGATGFKPPPGVKLNRIPANESMGSMLLAGKLDAALHYIAANNLVDRSKVDLDEQRRRALPLCRSRR